MDEFQDLMGITIETGDTWLDKKLNSHICYKGGGGGDSTTVQQTEPWAGQRPYLLGTPEDTAAIFPGAKSAYSQGINRGGYQPYLAGQTQEALGMTEDLARNNGALNDSVGFNQGVVNGDYMMGGDQFMSAYGNDIQDSINAQFAKSGRTNSGYHSNTIADGLGDAAARQWNNDIQNRQRASALAPGLTQAQYGDHDRLAGVGDTYENLDRQQFNSDINNQWDQLGNYNNIVQGNYGGTQTSESPLYRNRGAGVLGGAATGAGIGSSFGPWGTAIGGIGGGLLGGLF